MDVTKKKLADAARANIISPEQVEPLHAFLTAQSQDVPHFTFTHVLYYLGGFIAIGAMTLFMNIGWESFGGVGILLISALYAAAGLKTANIFSARSLPVPAGICATFVVYLTPLAVYGLQQWLGVWPDETVYQDYHRYVNAHWLYMELATLAVGVIVLWWYKFPFLVMPISVTLWYLAMDITALATGGEVTWERGRLVSLVSGVMMIGLAFGVDIRSRSRADYAFWLYVVGVVAFWGGLSAFYVGSEASELLYLCVNLLMIGVGVLLVRRVFVVFGALGCCGYLGWLAFDVFSGSWLFPITLTAIGLGVIYLGILWQKHEKHITSKARSSLPIPLREFLESRA